MKHKRLKLITVILLGLGLTGLQAQRVYIGGKEGSQTAYFVSNIIKMSFSSGEITVYRADQDLDTYALTDVRNLNFMVITSAVKAPPPVVIPEETLHVFPNPVIDVLNIQMSSPLTSDGRIEIISLEGKLVYTEAINGNDAVYQVNLSGLARGLYLCRIKSGSAMEITKIIKQ